MRSGLKSKNDNSLAQKIPYESVNTVRSMANLYIDDHYTLDVYMKP